MTRARLLSAVGGWVKLRCSECGTEFIATDGTPPPIAKASEVLTYEDSSRSALCPVCRKLQVALPTGATESVVVSCKLCLSHFIAELDPLPVPSSADSRVSMARLFSHSPELLPEFADGRWYSCPFCRKVHVLITDSDLDHTRITCPRCREIYTVGRVRKPPVPPVPKPPKSWWRAIWDWLKR